MSENENNEMKNCPFCGEEIKAAAKKCKHCGSWLDSSLEQKTSPSPATLTSESDSLDVLKKIPKATYIKVGLIVLVVVGIFYCVNYLKEENARNPLPCDSEYSTTELMSSMQYNVQEIANLYENYVNPSYSFWGFRNYKTAEDVAKIDDKTIGNKDVQASISDISETDIDKKDDTRTRFCSGVVTIKLKTPIEMSNSKKSDTYTQNVKYKVERVYGQPPTDSVKTESFAEFKAQ